MSVVTEFRNLVDSPRPRDDFHLARYLAENTVRLYQCGGGSFSMGHDYDVYLYLTKDGEFMEVGMDQGDPYQVVARPFDHYRRELAVRFPGLTEENAKEYYEKHRTEFPRR